MPYTMMIYPDEKLEIPKEGDIFIVTKVTGDIIDLHWGRGTYIKLERVCTCGLCKLIDEEKEDANTEQIEE